MPGMPAAVVLATALITLCPTVPRAEIAKDFELATHWRQGAGLHDRVAGLDDWLDENAEWWQGDAPPKIRLVSPVEAHARQGATGSFQRGRLRGLYDPDRAEILLVKPWDPRDPEDVSVLLHELVHHRQAPHHWYYPAAQALPAYRLQEAWLAERGMKADVNWVAVVLDAGCTRRDIHPD
ncbi:DUF6647 family protein [Aquicoccus sp.]|uniref:DUF6647 family protein n=1 Tax=Aquicoccus sp. TaxID=2055851 RepID=UPI0035674868